MQGLNSDAVGSKTWPGARGDCTSGEDPEELWNSLTLDRVGGKLAWVLIEAEGEKRVD